MKIIATLTAIHSKRDRAGNTCWAFEYTDHNSGQVVMGHISGTGSSLSSARMYIVKSDREAAQAIQYIEQEVGVREFESVYRKYPDAGCRPQEIALFIVKQLNPPQPKQDDENTFNVVDCLMGGGSGFDVQSRRLYIGNYAGLNEAEEVAAFLNKHKPRHWNQGRQWNGVD